MHSTRILVAALLFPAALCAQADTGLEPPPAPPPVPQAASSEAARELATKQAELAAVTEQIGQVQLRAEENDTVQTAKENFGRVLRTEMVRIAPDLETDIDRQAALVAELRAKPATAKAAKASEKKPVDDGAPDERLVKLQEYRALHAKLAPVEARVQDVAAVAAARKIYSDALMAEMNRLEPGTPDLLAKRRELGAVIRELTAQAQTG